MVNDREPGEWRMEAACLEVDPELFFPIATRVESRQSDAKKAARHCLRCPVRTECFQDAIATGEQYGVRGGYDLQAPKVREWIREAKCRTNTQERRST